MARVAEGHLQYAAFLARAEDAKAPGLKSQAVLAKALFNLGLLYTLQRRWRDARLQVTKTSRADFTRFSVYSSAVCPFSHAPTTLHSQYTECLRLSPEMDPAHVNLSFVYHCIKAETVTGQDAALASIVL